MATRRMRNKTKNKMKNKRKTRGGMNNVVEPPIEVPVGTGINNVVGAQDGNRGEQNLLKPLENGTDMALIVEKVNNIIDYLKKKNLESSSGIKNTNVVAEAGS